MRNETLTGRGWESNSRLMHLLHGSLHILPCMCYMDTHQFVWEIPSHSLLLGCTLAINVLLGPLSLPALPLSLSIVFFGGEGRGLGAQPVRTHRDFLCLGHLRNALGDAKLGILILDKLLRCKTRLREMEST